MKLSRYQKKIVAQLSEDNRFLWHDEGPNFKAWIGDKNRKVIKYIRRDSAEALAKRGIIKFVDGDYPLRLYKHVLAAKEAAHERES